MSPTVPPGPAGGDPGAFELPVRYFRDELAGVVLYAGRQRAVQALLPEGLRPLPLPGGRALVGIGAFHYARTSLGEYGEIVTLVPCVFGALARGEVPAVGQFVPQIGVTGTAAMEVGRTWGYPKFSTHIHFEHGPDHARCTAREAGRHILTLRIPKQGRLARHDAPLHDYTVRDGDLMRTRIEVRGVRRRRSRPRGVELSLGDHPFAETLRRLELAPRPWLSLDFLERRGTLPRGKIVRRGVGPREHYRGCGEVGELTATFV